MELFVPKGDLQKIKSCEGHYWGASVSACLAEPLILNLTRNGLVQNSQELGSGTWLSPYTDTHKYKCIHSSLFYCLNFQGATGLSHSVWVQSTYEQC